MKTEEVLFGNICLLRQIKIEDCTEKYVEWLNDDEVNRYLETKWSEQNIDTIRQFVRMQIESENSILFAICLNDKAKSYPHVGNIKIGPIHPYYSHADVSYFVGEKQLWGQGIATDAIKCACEYGFSELKLHRIEAGAYEYAIGSQRVLEKNGFQREGVFREQVSYEGSYIDIYRYGLLCTDIKKKD